MIDDPIIKADGFVVSTQRVHNSTRTSSRQWIDVSIVVDGAHDPTTVRFELPVKQWAVWAHRCRFQRDGPDFKVTLRSAWPEDK